MKTFIAVIALTFSLGVLANARSTMSSAYKDSSRMNQQRMEETKSKVKKHMDGTVESKESTTTKEAPMINGMEKDSTETVRKMKKVR